MYKPTGCTGEAADSGALCHKPLHWAKLAGLTMRTADFVCGTEMPLVVPVTVMVRLYVPGMIGPPTVIKLIVSELSPSVELKA